MKDSALVKAKNRALRTVLRTAAWACGRLKPGALRSDARRTLEQLILPALCTDQRIRGVLFIGVARYTSWYSTLFGLRRGLTFSTIDPDPAVERWGAKGHHRVDQFESLASDNSSREKYDAVVANGLFGYGTNTTEAAANVLNTAHIVLRKDGLLLVGFSDEGTFDLTLVDPAHFEAETIPGLSSHVHVSKNRNHHSFACFKKL